MFHARRVRARRRSRSSGTAGTARFEADDRGLRGRRRSGSRSRASTTSRPSSMAGAAPDELSHAAVAQALERHLQENPQDRGALQVVAAFRRGVGDVSPRYHYLPWVREGAAHAFTNAGHARARAREDRPATAGCRRCRSGCSSTTARRVDVPVRVYGPGDVVGIDPRAVLRTDPLARTADFEPNYLACIEFDNPDFPWLFTPAAAGRERAAAAVARAGRRAAARRAWSCARAASRRCRSSTRRSAELPDLVESWAWAHAQVVQMDATQPVEQTAHRAARPEPLAAALPAPARARDALPRVRRARVRGGAQGRARRGGDRGRRGQARAGVGRRRSRSSRCRSTTTGSSRPAAGGDFETLARRLKPQPVAANVGRRPLRVGQAAVRAAGRRRAPARGRARRARRAHAARADERVPQRAAQARQPRRRRPSSRRRSTAAGSRRATTVPADTGQPEWLRDLNLDPSARAVAGLGVVVVQKRPGAARRRRVEPARRPERGARGRAAARGRGRRARLGRPPPRSSRWSPGRLVQFLGPASTRMRTSPRDAARRAREPGPPGVVQRAGVPPRRQAGRAVEGRLPARAAAVPGDRDPARHVAAGARACRAARPALVTRPQCCRGGEQGAAHRDPRAPPLPRAPPRRCATTPTPFSQRTSVEPRSSSASRPSSRPR